MSTGKSRIPPLFEAALIALNRMDLVGAQYQKLPFFVVKNRIPANHLMRHGYLKDSFGKFDIIADRLVFLIQPPCDKFFV